MSKINVASVTKQEPMKMLYLGWSNAVVTGGMHNQSEVNSFAKNKLLLHHYSNANPSSPYLSHTKCQWPTLNLIVAFNIENNVEWIHIQSLTLEMWQYYQSLLDLPQI